MAVVNAGTVTPMNQISTTVTINTSTYSISLPNCTETGTWSASGNTLSFSVDPASTCGSSPAYTEAVYWNNPLLTLNLSSTTQDIIWQKQLDAPASPVAAVANGAVDISWQAVSGATSYKVYRGTASGTLATKTLIGSPYGNTWRDVTAAAGTAYYYQVTAVGASGESAPSTEITAALSPSPVTGLTATPGTGKVTLAWNVVSGADSYNVYHYTTGIGMCKVFAPNMGTNDYSLTGWTNIGSVTTLGATVNGTAGGICHQFMVTAVNAGGESLSMSYVDATPQ
jgi:fibronectin type 3 domain-containing protein